MKRGIRHSGKTFRSQNESARTNQCESASAETFSPKNLKKLKNMENKGRSASVHNLQKDSKGGREGPKMHSPVHTPHSVDSKLPMRKFYKLYSKIVLQLETVKNFSETKRTESENLVDLRRQLQRADEFSIRFSRNNLYETKRIINEIRQLMGPYTFDSLSSGHTKPLFRKVILAYQAASQSLQSYINYAKNPSNLEVPHKINELVMLVADMFLFCEQVCIPMNDTSVKNEAVRVCNELIKIFKSKVPVCEYVEIKDADLSKNKIQKKTLVEDGQKMKKLSMYKSKLTPKLKTEVLRKKHGMCLLGVKAKKSKREDKRAKITHDIYTQKLNPWHGKGQAGKFVKFDADSQDRSSNNPDDLRARRGRHATPREVKSQDDDVVTMVQAIGDDETSTCRLSSTTRDNDEDGELNQTYIKELLLEAIEGLNNPDKKEQKLTLRKLLTTIENCSRTQIESQPTPPPPPPTQDKVKVFHFLSRYLTEDSQSSGKRSEQTQFEQLPSPRVERETIPAGGYPEGGDTSRKENVAADEKKLKTMFKPLLTKRQTVEEVAARGRVKLRLPEETMRNANRYRRAFSEYRKNNIMYKKTLANKPWKLVGRVSDHIILDIIREISLDFENDAILRRLYLSELQEVTS